MNYTMMHRYTNINFKNAAPLFSNPPPEPNKSSTHPYV